jgi:5S rRNA maturation endonuclease (ribonuclease M5)
MIEYEEYVEKYRSYYDKLKTMSINEKLIELSELRKISLDEFNSAEVIYIDNGTKLLIPEYLKYAKEFGIVSNTNNKPIFNDRYVFPIKDWNGNIVNLVGYSKDSDERYVYGTGEWYRRRDMIYGLENLNYAYKKGWAILTEGISDTWALRQFGFKNVFGNCGVEFSDFKKEQLSRLKCGLIQIPDRDKPGLKLLKQTNIDKKVSLFVPIRYKDAAETVENGVDMTGVLSQVGEWLESKGILLKNFAEEVSM